MLQDAMKAARADMLAAGVHMCPVNSEEMALLKVICGE